MDFLDNAVNKAKEVFDVAYQKTNEVVTTQKQKFDIEAFKNKRNKDFIKLGELYYNQIKDDEIENTEIRELVDAINEKNQKIAELKDEINTTKNKRICPNCSANIDEQSVYCSVCGTKITFDGE